MSLPVAIDAGPLVLPRTGVGRFVELLLGSLDALPGQPVLTLPYVMSVRAHVPDGVRRIRLPGRIALPVWGHIDAPRVRARGAAVLHGPNYVVPPTRIPSIVSIHDCFFLRHPDQVAGRVHLFRAVLRRAIARGAIVHVPSEHTRAQVEEIFGTRRIAVIPLGAPPVVHDAPAPWIPGLDSRPYIVATATREPRKNLARLVDAFGIVAARHPGLSLVLVGAESSGQPAIETAISRLPRDASKRVLVLPYVGDVERDGLIRGAEALAFPSLDEGWGFPVLEAMALRTPVVAARAGSLPELCVDAAVLVDPLDVDELADGLDRVISDAAFRRRLVDAGTERIRRYAPASCAARFAELYLRVAETGLP